MNTNCGYYSDSEPVNRKKIRRSLKNLYFKMKTKNEMLGIGDGTSLIPIREPRKFNKMKVKDEMKLDLKWSESSLGSNRSRFKLYPIEEVSENSSQSQTSNCRRRIERDAEIQRIIEENKILGQNRPTTSHQKVMPVNHIKQFKPVTFNQSEESVMASVFKENLNEEVNAETAPDEFNADEKIAALSASVDNLLAYKQKQIERLAVASSYEFQKRLLRREMNISSSSNLVSKSVSTVSTFSSHHTTSCFGKLFCPFKKSRRQKSSV